MKKIISLFVAIIVIILAANINVNAANIVVTINADAGAGSLRQAIINASKGDRITFNLQAGYEIITIDSILPAIKIGLTIDGANTAGSGIPVTVQVTSPGVSPFRVFYIADTTGTDTIENMTIKGGDISKLIGQASFGGGIMVESGAVILISSTVSGSKANYGGGICNDFSIIDNLARVFIFSSTISGNSAIYYGGGICNFGNLSITSSAISGNNAGNGGGIYNESNDENTSFVLPIISSKISDNIAYAGGGIYNKDVGGDIAKIIIYLSTLSYNQAYSGGGIYNDCGGNGGLATITIATSTVSANSASYGGGIYNYGDDWKAVIIIPSSTISGNVGGGIYNDGNSGTAYSYLLNSIIINNTDSPGADINSNDFSTFTYAYYCWYNQTIGNINTQVIAPNDTTSYTKGNLDTLQINYPGTTATMATNTGCPAIGKGTFVYYNATDGYYFVDNKGISHELLDWDTNPKVNPEDKITTDQRGVTRSSPVTIGAYQGNITGLNEVGSKKSDVEIKVFPNPANGVLSIEYRISGKGNVNLSIYDIMGREVDKLGIRNYELGIDGEYKINYDAEGLRNGVYLIKFQVSSSKFQEEKVVKFIKL
jgi:hypothetical protein